MFYTEALKIAYKGNYDLVYASSSRLFTAFLGAKLARNHNAKLYLDIRDIFRESIVEIFKNTFVKRSLDFFLRPIERYTFKKATHINLVSKGFESYFSKYKQATYSYFTNGIDDVFLESKSEVPLKLIKLKRLFTQGILEKDKGCILFFQMLQKHSKIH